MKIDNSDMEVQQDLSSKTLQDTAASEHEPQPLPTPSPPHVQKQQQHQQPEEVAQENSDHNIQVNVSIHPIIRDSSKPAKKDLITNLNGPSLCKPASTSLRSSLAPVTQTTALGDRPDGTSSEKQLRLVHQHLFRLELVYPLKAEFATNS